MNKKIGYKLLGFIFVIMITGIACNAATPQTASPTSSEPNLQVGTPINKVESLPASQSVDGWVTFTNDTKLYTLDVPKDWVTSHWSKDGLYYLVDNFQSADANTYLEVFVADDGRPFSTDDETYTYALSVLDRLYAKGVKVEKRMRDNQAGREAVIWNAQDTRYLSVYKVVNKTSFVMLTIFGYSAEKASSDEVKNIIENFKVQ